MIFLYKYPFQFSLQVTQLIIIKTYIIKILYHHKYFIYICHKFFFSFFFFNVKSSSASTSASPPFFFSFLEGTVGPLKLPSSGKHSLPDYYYCYWLPKCLNALHFVNGASNTMNRGGIRTTFCSINRKNKQVTSCPFLYILLIPGFQKISFVVYILATKQKIRKIN